MGKSAGLSSKSAMLGYEEISETERVFAWWIWQIQMIAEDTVRPIEMVNL